MSGMRLVCDHDGCEVVFPEAPVRSGWSWDIVQAARQVGWQIGSPAHAYPRDGKDYCPAHARRSEM